MTTTEYAPFTVGNGRAVHAAVLEANPMGEMVARYILCGANHKLSSTRYGHATGAAHPYTGEGGVTCKTCLKMMDPVQEVWELEEEPTPEAPTETPTDYQAIEEWDTHEGTTRAYNTRGDEVIEIEPAQNEAQCAKWGEAYRPGRAWHTTHEDGTITHGHAANLREAKKAAMASLIN